jgi:hypothetical protein
MRHYAASGAPLQPGPQQSPTRGPAPPDPADSDSAAFRQRIAEAVGVICDEEALDRR